MNEIIVLDIETTGFNPLVDMIVEIGIVRLGLETYNNILFYNIDVLFDNVIRENNKVITPNAWIFKNSNLQYSEVMNAKLLDSYYNELFDILNRYEAYTSFNQEFDFKFLESRKLSCKKKIFDPMMILTDKMKIFHSLYGYKYPSVSEAHYFLFKEPFYREIHRATLDAIDEAKIVFECIKRGYVKV